MPNFVMRLKAMDTGLAAVWTAIARWVIKPCRMIAVISSRIFERSIQSIYMDFPEPCWVKRTRLPLSYAEPKLGLKTPQSPSTDSGRKKWQV